MENIAKYQKVCYNDRCKDICTYFIFGGIRINTTTCERLDRFIDKYYSLHQNSGYLRITLKDEIIYERAIGFSDIENKVEFTKESMFTLYSLSKPFCAIGILKLKDRGLVDIDNHPSIYLPEAKGFDERVTIRQLLHHVSGMPDFDQTARFKQKYASGFARQMREHLKELSHYPMVFEPGTDAMYANVNFVVCALIIENVSGMKYAEYMKKEVFEPLGMVSAIVDDEDVIIKHRTKGYELMDGKIIPADRTLDWMLGAGDIVGTVDDVYCLNKAIKHRLMLKTDTWEEILTPSPLNSMGMGCTVSRWHGKRRITHNGGSIGFRTLHIQLPEDDFDIIFLSNSGWGNARGDIADAIYEIYYGDKTVSGCDVKMDVGYI
jgi:CubicO group peptidase (beta-lactamase class C family)